MAALGTTLAGNLASGGVFAVALPVLAHQRFGTPGYGLLLTAAAILFGLSRTAFRSFAAEPD